MSPTLVLGANRFNYPLLNTDSSGFFTVAVSGIPGGTYNWRAKGTRYLENCGTVALSGARQTNQEMNLMRAGNANNDNIDSSVNFNILKAAFGGSSDLRADFSNDGIISSVDFTLLKNNFGQAGCTAIFSDEPGSSLGRGTP